MAEMTKFERGFLKLQFSSKARLRIYRKIIRLLENGVPLPAALESMYAHASNDGKSKRKPEAVVIDAWLRQVKNGKSLGVAIQGWVPETDRVVIDAGEASGDLPSAVENACFLYEGQKKIRSAVIKGIAYPAFLLTMVIAFLFLFGLNVIPKFATVLPREQWTGLAEQMAGLSDFVQSGLIPCLVGLACLGVLIAWSMPRWTGRLRVRFDKIPPWSIYKLVAGSGFLLSFAALTKAGVKQTSALRSIANGAKPWFHERITRTLMLVNNGLDLGEALHRSGLQFPDVETINDLRTYAKLNAFDEMLMKLGRENLEDTVARIEQQGTLMRNAGIILMGVTLAWLFMGIFAIQQQITSNL